MNPFRYEDLFNPAPSPPPATVRLLLLSALSGRTAVLLVTKKLGTSGSSLTHLINSRVCRFSFVMSWLCPLHFISAAPPSPSFSVHPDYMTVPLLKASSCFLSTRRGSVVLLLRWSACPPLLSFILPFLPLPLFLLCTMVYCSLFTLNVLIHLYVLIHFKIVVQEYSQYIRRTWTEQNFFVLLCCAYALAVVCSVSPIPPASGTALHSSRLPHPRRTSNVTSLVVLLRDLSAS